MKATRTILAIAMTAAAMLKRNPALVNVPRPVRVMIYSKWIILVTA